MSGRTARLIAAGVMVLLQIARPAAAAQLPTLPERGPLVTDYTLQVRLDEDGRTIRGSLQVKWKNQGAATSELWWHVYNNAWEHAESLWLRESRAFADGEPELPTVWGSTEVMRARLRGADGAPDQELAWEWQPQPEAPRDRTVALTRLPKPVRAGSEVSIALDFVCIMPRAFRRSGWGENGFLHAVQWFPKLGVWEAAGSGWRWNCLPYHFLTEFYADFGSYLVELTLPARYLGKVVASGSPHPSSPESLPDGSVRYVFHATDVHDFAWTADPEASIEERAFLPDEWRDAEEEQRVAAALGVPASQVRPLPVRMILMLQPEHEEYRERYFTAIARSLYYFGLWYGAYPYPTVTCVDPPHDARETGGMEYPRLFTGGVSKGRHTRTHSPESVTVHEFGHQFWYGLSANDEFNHAWLDEGFNTFSTQRVLAKAWPGALAMREVLGVERPGRAPLRLPTAEAGDLRALLSLERWESPELVLIGPLSLPLRRASSLERWIAELPPLSDYPQVVDDAMLLNRHVHELDWSLPLAWPTHALDREPMRRVNAYRRPALTLETMARLMGEEDWIRVMRAYHARTRFRHAQPEELIATVKEIAGASGFDWDDFWEQAYFGNQRLDFGVSEFAQYVQPDGSWTIELGVRRLGGFRVPVEIRLVWEDGEAAEFWWDGVGEVWTHRIQSSERRAALLLIDPERRLLLDRNWLNNARRAEPLHERARNVGARTWLWAQQMIHYYGSVG